jgi:hypothetical protein
MLFCEIIAVSSEDHMKTLDTMREQGRTYVRFPCM